jgi:hexosaminidase
LYTKPITLKVPQGVQRVLKTRVITPSGRQSAFTTTSLTNAVPLPAQQVQNLSSGLNYYFIPGDFSLTKELDTLKSTEKGLAPNFSLVKFRAKARTFGLIYDGYIQILEDGIYAFSTTSDDGSTLWIDDQLVVNNDEKHASYTLTGAVKLQQGFHKLQIKYFQAGGGSELRVWMMGPNGVRTEIPANLIMH